MLNLIFERIFSGYLRTSSNSKDMNILLSQVSFYLIIACVKCQECRMVSVCDSGEQSSSKGQFWVNWGVDRSDQVRNAGVLGKRGLPGPGGPPGFQGSKGAKGDPGSTESVEAFQQKNTEYNWCLAARDNTSLLFMIFWYRLWYHLKYCYITEWFTKNHFLVKMT